MTAILGPIYDGLVPLFIYGPVEVGDKGRHLIRVHLLALSLAKLTISLGRRKVVRLRKTQGWRGNTSYVFLSPLVVDNILIKFL